ncbi:MAG: hypothetical protein M3Q81_02385 [bacterium]|nr:hypothetical protein [bacterium]
MANSSPSEPGSFFSGFLLGVVTSAIGQAALSPEKNQEFRERFLAEWESSKQLNGTQTQQFSNWRELALKMANHFVPALIDSPVIEKLKQKVQPVSKTSSTTKQKSKSKFRGT